jgi:hypothetical protein
VDAPSKQVIERLDTVTRSMNWIANLRLAKRHVRQFSIVVIILD